ncbi:MAG: PEP-CTERM sorting domain-containing protein [Acidobacteria bacterium]|nr:PEP-CTERM sorting domain-containing protein [Acidobacteriota bacterium]
MAFKILRSLAVLALGVVGIAFHMDAAPIVTVPAGLSPGDHYRLVFVTSTTRDATSTAIADYNAFVTSAATSIPALLALGTTWYAIGSTATVNAIDNIVPALGSRPIYDLAGNLIATGSADLFDGSDIPHSIATMEKGGTIPALSYVMTGSYEDGTGWHVPPGELGNSWYIVGQIGHLSKDWINRSGSSLPSGYPMYGISGDLTVAGGAVPEPSTIALTALGGLLLFVRRRTR